MVRVRLISVQGPKGLDDIMNPSIKDRRPEPATTPAPSAGTAVTRRPRRWLYGEGARHMVALGFAALVFYPVLYATGVATPQDPGGNIANAVLLSCLYQLSYVALSLALFARASDDALAALGNSATPAGRFRTWVIGSEPGLAQALSLGALAMGTALWVLPRAERFASDVPVALVAAGSIGLIVGAWASMVVTYAIDYARTHGKYGGLKFPGEPPHGFTDYLYLAVVVSTTSSPGDVQVTTSPLRRKVTGHALVAFAFNTIILALAISSLVA